MIDQERLRTAVIGCGAMGTRRAEEAALHSRSRLLLCVDVSHAPARNMAERFGAAWSTNWNIAVDDDRIDVVVVCAPGQTAYEVALAALQRGKHVFLEAPMECDLAKTQALAAMAQSAAGRLKIGSNLRFHPAVAGAYELVRHGAVGVLTSLRLGYADGGRPGIDGVADLLTWFAGAPAQAFAYVQTARSSDSPDESACGLLRFPNDAVASVHVSRTHRRRCFTFELTGDAGSIVVQGLGGPFGTERIALTTWNGGYGPPDVREEQFAGPDRSWAIEWNQFIDAAENATPFWGTAEDGVAALQIVQALHESALAGEPVAL